MVVWGSWLPLHLERGKGVTDSQPTKDRTNGRDIVRERENEGMKENE